jgi:hypothetical protein
VLFLFESRDREREREKKRPAQTPNKKNERTEQIRIKRKEIEHSANKPHYTEKRDFD